MKYEFSTCPQVWKSAFSPQKKFFASRKTDLQKYTRLQRLPHPTSHTSIRNELCVYTRSPERIYVKA